MNEFSRTQMLLGGEAMEKLRASHAAVFGIGGVGSAAAEALARSGVGTITLVDNDIVAASNINRQLIALHSSIGMQKTESCAARLKDINPSVEVMCKNLFFAADTLDSFDFSSYTYVVDAIDTVSSKILLCEACLDAKVPLISSMGTGNKLHPERLELADIYETSVCPLARVMRGELRKRGIPSLKVVYSKEIPLTPSPAAALLPEGRRSIPGSTAFVPPAAGLIIAGAVVREIIL